MKYYNIKNTRSIFVKFLPPTNHRGSRIKLIDTYSEHNNSKVFSYCYKTGNVLQQAFDILTFNGANIVSRSATKDFYTLNIENWGEDFLEINKLKNI
mgnify:CR=1 FL=1|tara:strand:+ start:175 stop:465 length:291 start_codon:yes stop_codon:yes gene_type:complete